MINEMEKTPEKKDIKIENKNEENNDSLDGKSKKSLYEKIYVSLVRSPDEMKSFLIEAAIKLHKFPPVIQKKLNILYASYEQFHDNEMVKKQLEMTIATYIETEGFNKFKSIFEMPFEEKDWGAAILNFFAKKLNIAPEKQSPMVEAVIHQGKTHWRIVQGKNVLYERQQSNKCNSDVWINSWRMHWESFELFKHGGKRSSTVKITEERFINSFKEVYKEKISAIWHELKEKGILNSKDRLSEEWRALSNVNIVLSSLGCCDVLAISSIPKDQQAKNLPGKSRHVYIFTKDNFYYANKDTSIIEAKNLKPAALKDLKEKIEISSIGEKFRLVYDSLLFSCQKSSPTKIPAELKAIKSLSKHVLKELSDEYTYESIVEKLFSIANNENYKDQSIEKYFPKKFIFRQELNKKSWAETGLIRHTNGEDESYCTRLWHVGNWGDLNGHRNSKFEEEEIKKLFNQDTICNYDHIPSKSKMKEQSILFQQEVGNILDSKNLALSKNKEEIKQLKKNKNSDSVNELSKLKKEQENISKEITQLETLIEQAEKEEKEKQGKFGWTIAIPKKLHKDGNTHMESKKEQKKSTEHPFLADIKVHIKHLEEQVEKNQLSAEEYIKALGALRYLYHRQTTPSLLIDGQYSTSVISQSFFKDPKDLKKIDDLLNTSVKRIINHIEGYTTEESGTKDIKREIIFK